MKTIHCIIGGITLFSLGYVPGYLLSSKNGESDKELIEVQRKALVLAERIMNNNNLYDLDGSDDMSDFLDLWCQSDSLYNAR